MAVSSAIALTQGPSRTGIAYTHADVKRYVLGLAAGKRPRKPRPIKVPRGQR